MSKILVTGAHGQLGSELNFLSSLLENNTFVFVSHADLDITNEDDVASFFSQHQFSAVINCAAYTAVDKAETEKELAFSVNAEGAGVLAKAAAACNARFIHFSTDFVFDGAASFPYTETGVTNPISVYGASKLAGEEKVMASNTKAIIIRTSWVYSSFGNNFVKTVIRLCKEREQLTIIYDQIGTPTYARDLAAFVLELVSAEHWKPGIYNYSNEGVASWYDFALAIRDLAGLKAKILPIETAQYPTPAARPKYSVLNKRKLKETFGVEIPYWRDSLEKCITQLK
jgi:dTDP-4-dehydrorhamnose reductase